MSLLEDEKRAEERERTVANEKLKLQAAYANGLAIALVAVGTISPAIIAHPADTRGVILAVLVGGVCLIGSAILHSRAQRRLEGLQ